MNIGLFFVLMLLGNYALAVPLSPQAQQANPNVQINANPITNPYGFTNQVTTAGIEQLTTNSWIYTAVGAIVALVVIIFSIIILARFNQLQNAYVGDGRRIDGRIRLFVWGKGWVDFRATEIQADEIEEKLQLLREIDEIKNARNLDQVMQNIIDKIQNGLLHVYEIKVINRRNFRIRGNLGYSMLISSEAIDDRKFYYQSRNAVFAPFSGTWKEHPRIVDCIAQSKIYTDVEMAERGETTTVYVVGPWSGDFMKEKTKTFGENLEEFHIHPVAINVNMLSVTNGHEKDLAEILAILRTTSDTYQTSASFKKQAKIMLDANSKLTDELVIKNSDNMFLKAKVGERALVILGEKVIQKMTQESWMWVFAAIMMGLVGLELPHWIQSLSTTDPAVTFMACEAFVIMLKMITQKSENDVYGRYKNQSKSIEMGSGERQVLQ